MTTTNTSIRETLLSAEYWQGEVRDPAAEMGWNAYYQASVNVKADTALAAEICNVALSFQGGGNIQPIPEGQALSFPSDNPRQLIKIVQDARRVVPRFTVDRAYRSYKRSLKRKERRVKRFIAAGGEEQDFDTLAAMMTESTLYAGSLAMYVEKRPRELVVVDRWVLYARAAGEAGMGAVIPSVAITDDGLLEGASAGPVPPVAVGQVYRYGGGLAKISSAALMEADGVRWTHGDSDKPRKPDKPKRQLEWLPSFGMLPQ